MASHDIACIDGDWKLIEFADGKRALFDLAKDVGEERDLAASKPEIMKTLGARLDELKKDLPAAPERRAGPGIGGPGGGKGPFGKGKGLPK